MRRLRQGGFSALLVSPCQGPSGEMARMRAERRQSPRAAPPARFCGDRCKATWDLSWVPVGVCRQKGEPLPPGSSAPSLPTLAGSCRGATPVCIHTPRPRQGSPHLSAPPVPSCLLEWIKKGFPMWHNSPDGYMFSTVRGTSGADLYAPPRIFFSFPLRIPVPSGPSEKA